MSLWFWIYFPTGLFAGLLLVACLGGVAVGLSRTEQGWDRVLDFLAVASLLVVTFATSRWIWAGAGFAVYLSLSALLLWGQSLSKRMSAPAASDSGKVGRLALRLVFVASFLALFQVGVGAFGLTLIAILDAVAILVLAIRSSASKHVPDRMRIRKWCQRMALQAFPFLTIHLLAGSALAFDISGSYWGGQPYQAWGFVLWLALAALLQWMEGWTWQASS